MQSMKAGGTPSNSEALLPNSSHLTTPSITSSSQGPSSAPTATEINQMASHTACGSGFRAQGSASHPAADIARVDGVPPSGKQPQKQSWSSGWFTGGSQDRGSNDSAAQGGEEASERALQMAPFSRQRAADDNLRLSVTICEYLHFIPHMHWSLLPS